MLTSFLPNWFTDTWKCFDKTILELQCLLALFDGSTPGLSGGLPGLPGGLAGPAPQPPGPTPTPVVPRVVPYSWVARARHLGRDSVAVEPRARAG